MRKNAILSVCLAGSLLAGAGCASMELLTMGPAAKERAPKGRVTAVESIWVTQVEDYPDIANRGMPTPCLSGRVYLYGPDCKSPVQGAGTVVVHLTYTGRDGQPKPCEWTLSKNQLDGLLSPDRLGWGYNLVLPWLEYEPWIRQAQVQVAFRGPEKNAVPIYGTPTTFTLRQQGVVQTQSKEIPINGPMPNRFPSLMLPAPQPLANPGPAR